MMRVKPPVRVANYYDEKGYTTATLPPGGKNNHQGKMHIKKLQKTLPEWTVCPAKMSN